jgi:hypothetical protein
MSNLRLCEPLIYILISQCLPYSVVLANVDNSMQSHTDVEHPLNSFTSLQSQYGVCQRDRRYGGNLIGAEYSLEYKWGERSWIEQ